MWLAIFLLIAPIFLAKFLTKKAKNIQLPPGPKGLPFIGNLFEFSKPNIAKHLWELSKQYGQVMQFKIGTKPIVVISSAKMAEQVYKANDLVFASRPCMTGTHKISYNGLDMAFVPYGPSWREVRKTCVIHFFNSNKFQSFRPIREDEVSHLLHKISQSTNRPFNITKAILVFTSTLICRVAFGKSYEENGREANNFQALLKETEALFVAFFCSDYFPGVGWIVDKLSGLLTRLEKNFNEFDSFYQKLIDERLDTHKTLKVDEYSILDTLIQIQRDDSSKVDMSFDRIKAILMNVFLGGTETSAAGVIWAMCFLMKNPRAMKKVQEEIRTYVGARGFVNEDDVEKLPYIKAVVKETMRLQPPTPLLVPRETVDKCTLGGFEVKERTVVHVNAWAIGRDPEVWENPLEFNPERFIGSNIDMKGHDFGLIPFGAGRRICPGMLMGVANMELLLSNLLYKFDWEMPAGMRREDLDTDSVLPGITVHMKDPFCLVPKCYTG